MKAEAFLCAITGFFFGLITYLLLLFLKIEYAFVYGLLVGIVFYLLLFPYLCIHKKRMEKRYTEFDNVHLNIVTKDGRIFVITSPDVQKAITALRDKDCIKL